MIGMLLLINENNELYNYLQFTTERFSNKGLESSRFDLYLIGLENIIYYPFGGFTVQHQLFGTSWFHNIILDSFRVAGWIPILFFIIATMYALKGLLIKNKSDDLILIVYIFLICFLIMQQDVIIEGNYLPLIIYYLCGIVLVTYNKKDKNADKYHNC